jgi:hypothetical protein
MLAEELMRKVVMMNVKKLVLLVMRGVHSINENLK